MNENGEFVLFFAQFTTDKVSLSPFKFQHCSNLEFLPKKMTVSVSQMFLITLVMMCFDLKDFFGSKPISKEVIKGSAALPYA